MDLPCVGGGTYLLRCPWPFIFAALLPCGDVMHLQQSSSYDYHPSRPSPGRVNNSNELKDHCKKGLYNHIFQKTQMALHNMVQNEPYQPPSEWSKFYNFHSAASNWWFLKITHLQQVTLALKEVAIKVWIRSSWPPRVALAPKFVGVLFFSEALEAMHKLLMKAVKVLKKPFKGPRPRCQFLGGK